MNGEWENGFKAGFDVGYELGKRESEKSHATKISDPGPTTPDGLSYEEIYGSVVYQQNKKKE